METLINQRKKSLCITHANVLLGYSYGIWAYEVLNWKIHR